MISLTAAPAKAPDTAPPADPAAANDAKRGPDGKTAPFALLLGLALDASPAIAAGAESAADSKPDKDAAEKTEAQPIDLLLAGATAAAPVAIATGLAAVPIKDPKAPADNAALAGAAAPSAAPASSTVAASAAPKAAAPVEVRADPAPRVEPARHRETAADDAALPALSASTMPDAPRAPDAISSGAVAAAPPVRAAADASTFQARVAAPVHAPEFSREFATQVHFAVQRGVENASIAVHPPELGPVQMRVEISNGEARVHFAAESPATRDAISDALPKLREMLGSQGLTLSGSTVGAGLPQRDQPDGPPQGGTARLPGNPDSAPAAEATAVARPLLRLLDVFA